MFAGQPGTQAQAGEKRGGGALLDMAASRKKAREVCTIARPSCDAPAAYSARAVRECPVCGEPLPAGIAEANAHVSRCLDAVDMLEEAAGME